MNKKDLNINQEFSLFNEELEQETLGYLIIDTNYYEDIQDLKEDHFYFEKNKIIFQTIISMIQKDQEVNEVTVFHKLETKENLYEKPEDLKLYLKYIVDTAVASLSNIKSIKDIIINLYLKRKLNDLKSNISEYIKKEDDINSVVSKIETELYLLSSSNKNNEPKLINSFGLGLKEKLIKSKDSNDFFTGVETNFTEIDRHFGGFQNSDLIILAARPSMGKTALAVNIALNVARNFVKSKEKKSVAFFSLEMSGEQISARIISSETNLPVKTIHTAKKEDNKKISDREFISIVEAIEDFEHLPFFMDDTAGISIKELTTKIRRLKRKHNLGMVFIDYLQLLQSSKYSNNRILEISDITQGLKNIAKELNIPVVALSQLSRAVEANERKDKRPRLSDLRESGTIEQDADIVIFLYREAYYIEREMKINEEENNSNSSEISNNQYKFEEVKNKAELIISKNRNGPVGTLVLHYDPNRMLFRNMLKNSKNYDSEFSQKINKKIDKTHKIESSELDTSNSESDFIRKLKEKI